MDCATLVIIHLNPMLLNIVIRVELPSLALTIDVSEYSSFNSV